MQPAATDLDPGGVHLLGVRTAVNPARRRDGAGLSEGTGLRPVGRHVVRVHDFASERDERHGDEFQIRYREGYPDDRHGQRDRRQHVSDREPPPGEDDPHNVADKWRSTRAGPLHHAAPEWPEGVIGDPERGDSERDRDDEYTADHARDDVSEGHPDPAKQQPDNVEYGAHRDHLLSDERAVRGHLSV